MQLNNSAFQRDIPGYHKFTGCWQESDVVCGSDGQTYPSQCELDSTACRDQGDLWLAYKGDCGKFNFVNNLFLFYETIHYYFTQNISNIYITLANAMNMCSSFKNLIEKLNMCKV